MKIKPAWNTDIKSPTGRETRARPAAAHWQVKFFQAVWVSPLLIACLAFFLLVADPALAQSIDLSPIQNLLQGIVDALTGPLGVVIATLAVLGVFLSWFFNIIDLRQALWVLVGIAGVAAAPTIVAAVFGG
jgi:type IV secretion system protein VirB2